MLRKISKKGSFGKLHFGMWVLLTIVNSMIVLNEERKSRMMLLVFVVVLQFASYLYFMIDYEKLGRTQWKKKEMSLRKKLSLNNIKNQGF